MKKVIQVKQEIQRGRYMFPDSLPSIIPYPGWLTSFTKGLGFFYCILNSYILMRKLLSKPSQTVRCITKCIPQGLGRKVFPLKCTPKVAKLCSHEISGDITDDETATCAHEDDTKWIACCFISLFQHPNDVKFTKKKKNSDGWYCLRGPSLTICFIKGNQNISQICSLPKPNNP